MFVLDYFNSGKFPWYTISNVEKTANFEIKQSIVSTFNLSNMTWRILKNHKKSIVYSAEINIVLCGRNFCIIRFMFMRQKWTNVVICMRSDRQWVVHRLIKIHPPSAFSATCHSCFRNRLQEQVTITYFYLWMNICNYFFFIIHYWPLSN